MREILIRFDDNKAAERFVEILDTVQNHSEDWSAQDWEDWELNLSGILASCARLDAVLARPTMGCKHPQYKGSQANWSKHEGTGWFVCPECGRPSIYVVRRWLHNIVLGSGSRNLLPGLLEKFRTPKEAPTADE